MVKDLPADAGDLRDSGSIPGKGRCPGGGSPPGFFPGESHEGSLVGYAPKGHKESDMTEVTQYACSGRDKKLGINAKIKSLKALKMYLMLGYRTDTVFTMIMNKIY